MAIVLKEKATGDIANPDSGYQTFFVDSATNIPSLKDSGGTVTAFAGTTGTTGEIDVTSGVVSIVDELDLGGKTSVEIPNGAAPTVDADGEIAVDTTVTDFSHGLLLYYGGEEMGVVSMPIAEFGTPSDGAVPTYNATNDEFELAVPSGTGDVVGPASATDNAIALFDGTTGKLIQDSAVLISTDDTLASDSDSNVPTEQAVKAYVDGTATAGVHEIYIAASSMIPHSEAPCSDLATVNGASGQPDINTLDFDATTQEYAQFSIRMPKSWNEGTVTFTPHWSHAATTTNFGVVWNLQAVAVSNDDTIVASFGTAQTSTDTGGTTSDLYTGPTSSAITIAGTPAEGDMVFFRVSRVTGDGSDDMAIDARLHGITLNITTDAENDA